MTGVIWLYGRSAAGKTTLATALAASLRREGRLVMLLDGDAVRASLNRDLGFDDAGRTENIRRIAEVA
ncbi:MAG: adenylyl-sulfate kinase, partial [Vicinamibacterales bacterium]